MTVSQVCAFCPPPCRKMIRGGLGSEGAPQRNALILPSAALASTRSTSGSGPETPACSAFSDSSENSDSPASSSSEISVTIFDTRGPLENVATANAAEPLPHRGGAFRRAHHGGVCGKGLHQLVVLDCPGVQ